MKVLVVEDEKKVASFIKKGLEEQGFRVERDLELSGVDVEIHAETAYDLHVAGGARPHFGQG